MQQQKPKRNFKKILNNIIPITIIFSFILTNTTYGTPIKYKQDTLRAPSLGIAPLMNNEIQNSLGFYPTSCKEEKEPKTKRYIAIGLCGLALLGCQRQNLELILKDPPAKVCQISQTSYTLEELCDTDLYEKDITINVYIEPSNILWDYHKYKDEIFGYVKNFFKENQINCNIIFSDSKFKKFNTSNEFGLEIWDSEEKIEKRYFQLITEQGIAPKNNPFHPATTGYRGYAVTKTGVALVNGGWEEFRDEMKMGSLTIEEVEKQFLDEYKGITVKEYHFKSDIAANISHELGHCMGLFHPNEFNPLLVKTHYKEIPNIMSFCNMKIKKGGSIGYCLNPLQKNLIHSFIAGNNSYKAFIDSQRDLEVYLDNLKKANKGYLSSTDVIRVNLAIAQSA